MALTKTQLDKQKKDAEELLFDGPEKLGFAKALFFGHFRGDLLFPYPKLDSANQAKLDSSIKEVQNFVDTQLDDVAIDRNAEIPQSVIDGLAKLGVLGMAAPEEIGGKGFNQQMYCQILEILGAKCSSTSVFVNAHHSIGIRSLLLFGTEEQKKQWLPDLVAGKKLGAFALTEREAGSDAGNVQTVAVPTEDGKAFLLTGEKRYITNGGIADVLTVMARTPAPSKDDPNKTNVTAFLVTPDMPGFEVIEKRAEKTGIKGTATGRMKFTNMRVPKENILGQMNKGLKHALNVLNFGRTTFGATCTGHAKACVKAAVEHVKSRVQFQQPLAEFELVKKKIAFMGAHAFAMEAATTICAAFIDSGADDYMLETAIMKIFATEHLWTIVYDMMQVMGGKSYFCDVPYERWMRDARINTIGEGANEVLKAFVAVMGCRAPGMQLDAMRKKPVANVGKLAGYGVGYLWKKTFASGPSIPVRHAELQPLAKKVSARINRLGTSLPGVFMQCGTEERFIQAQLLHERLADISIDLYVSSCVLSRLDAMLSDGAGKLTKEAYDAEIASGKHFITLACRRMDDRFTALTDHDDTETVDTANAILKRY